MSNLKFINPEKTKAIIIGVSEFQDKAFVDAPPIKNNVEKLADLLKDEDILGLSEKQILLINKNEDNGKILKKIRKFVVSTDDDFTDTVLFYFAGHGYKDDDDKFYLVTNNTDKEDIDVTSIPWTKIKRLLEKSGIQQRLYILDACHSGAAALGENDTETQISEGSALIAAAKAGTKSYFNTTDTYTHFTAAFIDVLENGIAKTNTELLDTSMLFGKLDKDLQTKNFEITKKTTHQIDNVSFFKNKAFDELSIKRQQIVDYEKQGKQAQDKLNFDEADRLYLKAYHNATQNDDFKEIVTRLDRKIKDLKKLKSYKQVYATYYKSEINKKETALAELTKQKTAIETQNNQNKKKQDELNSQIAKLEQQLKTTIAEDKKRYDKLYQEKQEIENKLKTGSTQLNQLQKQLHEAQLALKQNSNIAKANESKITELTKQKTAIETENNQNKKKQDDLNSQIAKLEQQLKTTIAEDKKRYDKLHQEKQEIEKKLKTGSTQLNQLQKQLHEAQLALKQNSNIAKANESKITELTKQKTAIETENNQNKKKQDDLNSQIAKLEQQLKTTIAEDNKKYDKLYQEKQEIENQLNQKQKAYSKLTSKNKTLIKKIADLEKSLKEKPSKSQNYSKKAGNTDLDMIFVQGGTFLMGSPKNDKNADDIEKPQHKVLLDGYYISKYQVTQKLWKQVMGNNPSKFKGENNPVEKVSWYDAIEFCNKLSQQFGLEPYYNIDKDNKDPNNNNGYDDKKWTISINKNAKGYRLPTEAEWEYAARGGNKSQGYEYAGSNNIDDVAWYEENSKNKTHLVVTKQANELGIYDMSGNVWEWCWDWYGDYNTADVENPQGADNGSGRVYRGGGWSYYASYCRVADRHNYAPSISSNILGFRPVSF